VAVKKMPLTPAARISETMIEVMLRMVCSYLRFFMGHFQANSPVRQRRQGGGLQERFERERK